MEFFLIFEVARLIELMNLRHEIKLLTFKIRQKICSVGQRTATITGKYNYICTHIYIYYIYVHIVHIQYKQTL